MHSADIRLAVSVASTEFERADEPFENGLEPVQSLVTSLLRSFDPDKHLRTLYEQLTDGGDFAVVLVYAGLE